MQLTDIPNKFKEVCIAAAENIPVHSLGILLAAAIMQVCLPILAPALWTLAATLMLTDLSVQLFTVVFPEATLDISVKILSYYSKFPYLYGLLLLASLAFSFLHIAIGITIAAALGMICGIVMSTLQSHKRLTAMKQGWIPDRSATQLSTTLG